MRQSASFHQPEPGLRHADQMPDIPPPEEIPRTIDRLEKLFGTLPPQYRESPVDVRYIGPLTFEAERDPSLRRTHNLVWLRMDGELPTTLRPRPVVDP